MLKEIIQSWAISFNPTEKQLTLAEKRYQICMSCEHKSEGLIEICKICECPIQKKIFSPLTNSCPLKKWYIS